MTISQVSDLPHRAVVLWTSSFLFLLLLFHFTAPSYTTSILKTKLRGFFQHYHSLTVQHFTTPHFTYIKVPTPQQISKRFSLPHNFLYIGSTNLPLYKREANRIAKFRQVTNHQLVKVELAIRWWAKTGNFWEYVLLPLSPCTDKKHTFVTEHSLIQVWQPKLNHPWITRFLKLKDTGYVYRPTSSSSHTFSSIGRRLFQRLRRKHLPHIFQPKRRTASISHVDAWNIIYDLISNSLASFTAAKHIRSNAVSPLQLYALYRLANNLEQPHRSIARSSISKALKFRQLSIPRCNKPLSVPFLSQPSFSMQLRAFLSNMLKNNVQHTIPLHHPTSKPREAAHQSVASALWNHKVWQQRIAQVVQSDTDILRSIRANGASFPHRFFPCKCHVICSQHTQAMSVNGHVASPAQAFHLSASMQSLAAFSAASTFYLSKTIYVRKTSEVFQKWLVHHGLPQHLLSQWQDFVQQHWFEHTQHVKAQFLLHSRSIFEFKQLFTEQFVIHCADHEPHRIMIYCPNIYAHTVVSTWTDTEVFRQVQQEPTTYRFSTLPTMVPKHLMHAYASLINTTLPLPYGYCFLKAKKQFTTARTIVSYCHTALSKLLRYVAIILTDILPRTWPDTIGNLSTPQFWRSLQSYFQSEAAAADLVLLNDDLVGFFNSVPQDRLLTALTVLLQDYHRKFGNTSQSWQATAVTAIDIAGKIRVHRGSYITHHSTKKPHHTAHLIHLQHIPEIVRLSFHAGVFQALGLCWIQVRGTSMGNQISPILSAIAVSYVEKCWQTTYNTWWSNHKLGMFLARYVDNRIAVLPTSTMQSPPMQLFAQADFYGSPVLLEQVGTTQVLGFSICTNQRTISYNAPSQHWQFRSPQSAGSMALNLSGYRSRINLIAMYAHPVQNAIEQIQQLHSMYVNMHMTSQLTSDSNLIQPQLPRADSDPTRFLKALTSITNSVTRSIIKKRSNHNTTKS